jgi:arylsulfatase A-like enzyme
VLATLRDTGREGSTIVFFLSDNGGRREAVVSSNGALRGYKEQLFEGGIRVPFLMRWPGTLAGGQVYQEPVIALDVFATAAAVSGARPPTDRKLDGVDLLPHLLGRKKGLPHDRLFWRTGGGQAYAVRHGDYKLVQEKGTTHPLLFDLARDPGETRDQAAQKPAIVRELSRAYDAWNSEMIAPVFRDDEARR